MKNVYKKSILIITVVFLLVLAFISTYSLHFNYRFPYHHDEWQHIAISMQAMKNGYNTQSNPYLGTLNPHADLEPGFHLFLSTFFLITGFDTILHYKYLAATFSVLSAFLLFILIYKLSKSFFTAIVSILLFIFLKSNVNILGKEYFTPLTMAFPFMILFIFYFLKWLHEKNFSGNPALLFFVLLIFIHPPSAIILVFPALIEIFLRKKEIDFRKAAIFFLALALISLPFIMKGNFIETKKYVFELLTFESGWGKLEIRYFIPFLYGTLNSLLAAIGFFFARKTKLRFFISLAFVSLALTSMYNLLGFTFLIPYSRAIHYSMLALIPLSAIGFSSSLDYVSEKFRFDKKAVYTAGLLILVFSLLTSTYELDSKYKRYSFPVIDEKDYSALLWAKENLEPGIFITPYFMTSAVYPVSGHRTISIIPAPLSGGFIDENQNFFEYNCPEKKKIIDKTNASYILSKFKLDCDFLREVYSNRDYLYEVLG